MPESGSYCVLLGSLRDLQFDKISQTLSAFSKAPLIDCRQVARRCFGIIGEHLSEPEAKRLVDHAAQNGLNALVVEEKDLVSLPEPSILHGASFGSEGVSLTGSPDGLYVPWDQTVLVAAAAIREETSVTKMEKKGPTPEQKMIGLGITMVTGIPIRLGGKERQERTTVKGSELTLLIDLFLRGPSPKLLSRLRMNAYGFNFSCLAENKMPDMMSNFRRLVQLFSTRATRGLKNRGVEVLLAGQPLNTMGYENVHDYEKELRWLLTLSGISK